MAKQKRSGSLVWGVILIVVGVVVLFDQFDIHVFDHIWRFWPAILILWGADKLVRGLKERDGGQTPDKGHEV